MATFTNRISRDLAREYGQEAVRISDRFSPVPAYWDAHPMTAEIDEIATGSFRRRDPPEIRGTGHVVRSLEAALWAFAKGANFREGALLAVNLGDDADTTGAVYGQIAGAFYGASAIHGDWLSKLHARDMIASFADRLAAPYVT